MMLSLAITVIIATFAVQLLLCFRGGKKWIKFLPLVLIALGELSCAVGYFLFDHIYGAAFVAVIYAVVLLVVLCGDAAAWLIYRIVRRTQKS